MLIRQLVNINGICAETMDKRLTSIFPGANDENCSR